MKPTPPQPTPLRGAAEAELAKAPPSAPASTQTTAQLLYELQVHQIELEMQNEALREAQVALEESRDRYVDLYEFAPVGYLTLSGEGRIAAINLTGATLLGEDRSALLQRRFDHFVAAADHERWQRHFLHALPQESKLSCELTLQRRDGTRFAACLDSLRVASAALPALRVTITDISPRRRAEQALQESEARFRAMADAAPVLIWVAGVDQGCVWFNQQWLEFTGRTLAQEVGDGWTESLHADDRARCLRLYRDAFERRERFELEYRLRRADGQFRWLLDCGVPRYGAEGEFLGYIGSCIDVSRLKRTEEDLNRAQRVGRIGSWRFDARRDRFSGSRETQRIYGVGDGAPLSYAELLGRIPADEAETVAQRWNAGTRGEPYDIEHRLLVDGEVRWVREKAEFEFDADGQLHGGFGITQDITEIKEARQALLESQERFRAFMTNSPVASWIVDAEGRFEYVSPTYYETFLVPTTDLVGKSIGEVYPPEFAERYLLANQAAFRAWQPVESVQPGLRPDGSGGEFLVVKFPIRDLRDRPLLCGMALDITERRQAVAELRAANERLESLAAAQAAHLRELAGELTRAEQRERDRLYERLHDDVQPLLVAARLALSGLSPRTPASERLQVAAGACEHISRVIDVARTLSLQLSPPLIHDRGLNPALESLSRWVRENHGLVVELDTEPAADPGDLAVRLVCFNAVRELLMNVVKHADTGRVTLTLRRVDNQRLSIRIADFGSGFDPAAVTCGSGLAGIERRLSMFGGSLEIESHPGQGTVATLLAPLALVTAEGWRFGRRDRRKEKGDDDAQDPDRR